MADLDLTAQDGLTDKRVGRGVDKAGGSVIAEIANVQDINHLRSRLTTISSTKYSAARLDSMTKNDMIYALRLETGDVAGI